MDYKDELIQLLGGNQAVFDTAIKDMKNGTVNDAAAVLALVLLPRFIRTHVVLHHPDHKKPFLLLPYPLIDGKHGAQYGDQVRPPLYIMLREKGQYSLLMHSKWKDGEFDTFDALCAGLDNVDSEEEEETSEEEKEENNSVDNHPPDDVVEDTEVKYVNFNSARILIAGNSAGEAPQKKGIKLMQMNKHDPNLQTKKQFLRKKADLAVASHLNEPDLAYTMEHATRVLSNAGVRNTQTCFCYDPYDPY